MFDRGRGAAILVTLSAVSACGGGDDASPPAEPAATAVVSQAEPDEIFVQAPYDGGERRGFERVLSAFTAETGIDVTYEVLTDNSVLEAEIGSGELPDVTISSRPGEFAERYRDGVFISLAESGANMDVLTTAFSDTALRLGVVDGDFVGLPVSASPKSTVWYRPTSFADNGYAVPRDVGEWSTLMQRIVDDGSVPLSVGGGVGWPLTDWFENIYLRIVGPEGYDSLFRTHDTAWTDPTVVQAMEVLADLWSPTDDRVLGGAEESTATAWNDAIDPFVVGDAEFYALGGFLGGVIADGYPDLVYGEDYDFFAFPDVEPAFASAQMLGADFAIALNDEPQTGRFLEFMASAEAALAWANADQGARVIPSLTAQIDDVEAPLTRQIARTIRDAQVVVFDGSDIAPSAVGGEAMFIELQNFLRNPDDIMGPLERIEAAAIVAYDR